MRNWLKTLLLLSALSPALITLAYVRYSKASVLGYDTLALATIGSIGTLLPIIILRSVEKHSETLHIQVKKVETNDALLIAFVASYLFPLVGKGMDMPFEAILFFLLFLGALLWFTSALPTHPVLRFFKFRFYKIESSTGMVYTLITKKEIRDPREIKNVKRLSETMFMECENHV